MADNTRDPGSTLERIASAYSPQRSKPYLSERFTDAWLTRWLRCMEPYGFLVGVIALVVAAAAFVIDLYDRQEERVVRAWQLVTTQAAGNSGKKEALEYLNRRETIFGWPAEADHWAYDVLPLKRRVDLVGIDLSVEKGQTGAFLVDVQLPGANLRKAKLAGAILTRANLLGADLEGADLTGAQLVGANLTHAVLDRARLVSANLKEASFASARLFLTELTRATFIGTSEADFLFALEQVKAAAEAVSGQTPVTTSFDFTNGLTPEQVGRAWACQWRLPNFHPGWDFDFSAFSVPCDARGCPIQNEEESWNVEFCPPDAVE